MASQLKASFGDSKRVEEARKQAVAKIAELKSELARKSADLKRKTEELKKLAEESAMRAREIIARAPEAPSSETSATP